jgi:hypothetical protein
MVLRPPPARPVRVSQLPAAHMAAHKNTLARLLRAAPFVPRSFVLPADVAELEAHAAAQREPLVLICKPVGLGEGRGVFLVPLQPGGGLPGELLAPPLPTSSPTPTKAAAYQMVAQHYVRNPLLVGGPHLLLYREGLVRFAAEPYSTALEDVGRPAMHLCNNAVNRRVDANANDRNWTFARLAEHLGAAAWARVWAQLAHIAQTVCVALLGEAAEAGAGLAAAGFRGSCFQLFGFDVLVDDACACWLLEVNSTPDISAASRKFVHTYQTDYEVKSQLLAHLLNVAFFAPPHPAPIPSAVRGLFEDVSPPAPAFRERLQAATAAALERQRLKQQQQQQHQAHPEPPPVPPEPVDWDL